MACRETFDIWYRIKIRPSVIFSYRYWKWAFKSGYFWHDSFGKYINRWVVCKFFSHKNPQFIDSENGCDGEDRVYCFACETDLPT